jgi:hypothetical protein
MQRNEGLIPFLFRDEASRFEELGERKMLKLPPRSLYEILLMNKSP